MNTARQAPPIHFDSQVSNQRCQQYHIHIVQFHVFYPVCSPLFLFRCVPLREAISQSLEFLDRPAAVESLESVCAQRSLLLACSLVVVTPPSSSELQTHSTPSLSTLSLPSTVPLSTGSSAVHSNHCNHSIRPNKRERRNNSGMRRLRMSRQRAVKSFGETRLTLEHHHYGKSPTSRIKT